MQLRSTKLCLGAAADGKAAVLVPCSGNGSGLAQPLIHHRTTGQIGDGSTCVDVPTCQSRWPCTAGQKWPAAVANAQCAAIPTNQQYQFNPQTGALRPKGSSCVADFKGTVNQYRDCCLSVCVEGGRLGA